MLDYIGYSGLYYINSHMAKKNAALKEELLITNMSRAASFRLIHADAQILCGAECQVSTVALFTWLGLTLCWPCPAIQSVRNPPIRCRNDPHVLSSPYNNSQSLKASHPTHQRPLQRVVWGVNVSRPSARRRPASQLPPINGLSRVLGLQPVNLEHTGQSSQDGSFALGT